MTGKRIVKLTACFVSLLFVGILISKQNGTFNDKISQLLKSVKDADFTDIPLSTSKEDTRIQKQAQTNKDITVESTKVSQPLSVASSSFSPVEILNKTSTQSNATAVAISNTVGTWKSDAHLVQGITALLKAQLKLNNTATPFSVTKLCKPRSECPNCACVHKNCTQLSNNNTERVQSLISEKTVLTQAQDDLLRSISVQVPENDVILLSAASSNHYDEMQAMLHSLHTMVFPELSKRENFSLVLWDIGLTSEQRQKVQKCCRCQVISFPFEKFPKHFKVLHSYAWKPLIIRMALFRANKYVVWQDACIRYTQFPGPLFEKGRQQGLLLMRETGEKSTVHRTLPETFAYFAQKVCSFYPYQEIASGFGVYKRDPFVLTAVTNPWARCGLEEKCMCPRSIYPSLNCEYGPCHRFDQSALTIITATLYGSEVYRIIQYTKELAEYYITRREHKEANYFNSTGCLSQ